jgi:hypothetical protein
MVPVEKGQEIFRVPVECGSVLHFEAAGANLKVSVPVAAPRLGC